MQWLSERDSQADQPVIGIANRKESQKPKQVWKIKTQKQRETVPQLIH